jgi:hypothetical protein
MPREHILAQYIIGHLWTPRASMGGAGSPRVASRLTRRKELGAR